jgi:phosphohistidine phosphatase SixA
MHSRIPALFTFFLMASMLLSGASGETLENRCAQAIPECPVLACNEKLIREVREAHARGDLVELLRHTEKEEGYLDDESTPLTHKGIEQAEAIHEGLIKTGLIPSNVQVSSYTRTRDTAARAVPRRKNQTWSEPPELREDRCFDAMPEFLQAESRTRANSLYVTHSNCIFSVLHVNGAHNFDPHGEENYGVMIFLNRKNLHEPVACMWPSDWSLWPMK